MKRGARDGAGDIFDQLALRLRDMTLATQINDGSGVERYKLNQVSPLILEHVDGDNVIEDGDPDVTVGALLRKYLASESIEVGDVVFVLREDSEWHILDVVGVSP